MNIRISISILAFLAFASFSCNEETKKIINYNSNDGNTDVTTMATPNGTKLRPAQSGPVRSALGEPKVDLNAYQLEITGLVDSSYSLSWEDILKLPAVSSDTILMYCVEGWEVWGNWKGILIKPLLDKARIQSQGEYVHFGCLDGYATSLPIDYLAKYNTILAYEVNGQPLKAENGYPLRLVAFGKYGYKWAKWINKVEVIDESQLGYWEKRGYSDEANVPLDRRKYYEGENVKPLEY